MLQNRFGYNLPKAMHPDFGRLVKQEADRYGAELPPERLLHLFLREYSAINRPYALVNHSISSRGAQAQISSLRM